MRYVLSVAEFELDWAAGGFGEPPLIFRDSAEDRVLTERERAQVVAEAADGLRGRRLTGTDGLFRDLIDMLALLANPSWVVDARIDRGQHADGGERLRAYGASRGDAAVVATLAAGQVTIVESTSHRLPADIAGLAGERPPGDGRSINVAAGTLLAAAQHSAGDNYRLVDELVGRGVQRDHARALAAVNAAMTGSGQFGAEVAGRDGQLRRAARVVGYCDTTAGRWAQLRTTTVDGRDWITLTPATTGQLAGMIVQLLAETGAAPVPV